MPAIITHDTFGQIIYDRLYSLIGGSKDASEAFLLGNQGPDPLFYLAAHPRLFSYARLGHTMHNEKPSLLIAAFKGALSILNDTEQAIGNAYALGFLGHYTLDSIAHPFVYYHQFSLCNAGEPGLSPKDGSEVHGVIERELDELVLFTTKNITIETFNPAHEILKASNTTLAVISKMLVYVALSVYGQEVPHNLFEKAVKSFRRIQRVFYSPSGSKRCRMGQLERIVRNHSFFEAMSHTPVTRTESIFDNHQHDTWENPFTHKSSSAGFWDLFYQAVEQAQKNMTLFTSDCFGLDEAKSITNNLDFSGKPLETKEERSCESSSHCIDVPPTPKEAPIRAHKTTPVAADLGVVPTPVVDKAPAAYPTTNPAANLGVRPFTNLC